MMKDSLSHCPLGADFFAMTSCIKRLRLPISMVNYQGKDQNARSMMHLLRSKQSL